MFRSNYNSDWIKIPTIRRKLHRRKLKLKLTSRLKINAAAYLTIQCVRNAPKVPDAVVRRTGNIIDKLVEVLQSNTSTLMYAYQLTQHCALNARYSQINITTLPE